MPAKHQWQSRIKAVEREYVAMRQAADRFLHHAHDDPTILLGDLRHGEIVSASRNLEGTYVMRLFAEFETGARQFWDAMWGTDIKTYDLFQGWLPAVEFRTPTGTTGILSVNIEIALCMNGKTGLSRFQLK